jgi:hypothetical protein
MPTGSTTILLKETELSPSMSEATKTVQKGVKLGQQLWLGVMAQSETGAEAPWSTCHKHCDPDPRHA